MPFYLLTDYLFCITPFSWFKFIEIFLRLKNIVIIYPYLYQFLSFYFILFTLKMSGAFSFFFYEKMLKIVESRLTI
jgi:hypothetical protein